MEFNIETTNILITPISEISKCHYLEQMSRIDEGKEICWNDSKRNLSKRGDIFIFSHYDSKVEFFYITKVVDCAIKYKTWSGSERNTIFLSNKITEWSWSKWIENGGHRRVQGTKSVITNKNSIIRLLIEENPELSDYLLFQKITYEQIMVLSRELKEYKKQILKIKDILRE